MARQIVPRVEFFCSKYHLQSGKFVQSLRSIFGERAAKYANCEAGLWIECSPTQFVDWQIIRNQLGCTNSYRDLKVRRFTRYEQTEPEPAREIFP